MLICKEYPSLDERVWKGRTGAGLRVRVIPKPGFAKTYAFLAADYGSMDLSFVSEGVRKETPLGVAHYLEHKMFDLPDRDATQLFSQYGGNPNAFTSYDTTAYYVEFTDHLAENLQLLLDMVFTPWFTEESVEKERGIIAQEIRMYDDSADSRVFENLFSALYQFHPIRHSIAGTVESIAQITPQTLYDCHAAYYTPENMILCVVGDVDPELVFRLADDVKPGKPAVTSRDYGPQETMSAHHSFVECTMEVSMPVFALGFKTEPAGTGRETMLQDLLGDLAAEVLVGESSMLYAELYRKGIIDAGFSCGYESVRGAGLISASGDSEDPRAVLDAILSEAERIRREGMDLELFHRLKRSMLGRWIRGLDSFESICYRTCAYEFDNMDYFEFLDVFRDVTPEQVAAFLDKTVRESRAALSVVWPKDQEV
jgi:predicted Zn-dependent peptidase